MSEGSAISQNLNAPAGGVQGMIEQIVRSLVNEPDAVRITAVEESQETVLELQVAQPDVCKVIGKQGRTVRALRSLLSAAGARSNKAYILEILEDSEDQDGDTATVS